MNFLSAVVFAAVIICFIMALRHVIKNLSSGSCAHCSGCPGSAGSCPKCRAAAHDKKGKTGNA